MIDEKALDAARAAFNEPVGGLRAAITAYLSATSPAENVGTAEGWQPRIGDAGVTAEGAVVLAKALEAVAALDDWTNVNETEFTGWGDGDVPPTAEFWRVKSGQALKALREINIKPRAMTSPAALTPSGRGGQHE